MISGLVGGRSLTEEQALELKARWKTLGSAFSTGRMTFRFMGWLENLTFFATQLKLLVTRDKKFYEGSKLEYVMNLVDMLGSFFDNWVFLVRIKILKYNTKWQEVWVDWLSSAFTVVFITLQITEKLLGILKASKKQFESSRKLKPDLSLEKIVAENVLKKKLWFI